MGERLVAWGDEPVGDAVVDGIFADIDLERFEHFPFTVDFSARRDFYRPAFGCGQQAVPGFDGEIGALSGCFDGLSVRAFRDGDDLRGAFDVKIEGRDGSGNRYADVVGINVRLPTCLLETVGIAGAREDGKQ